MDCINTLYNTCLEYVGKNCLLYFKNSTNRVTQYPKNVIKDLLNYICAKDLVVLESFFDDSDFDLDSLWKSHFEAVWGDLLFDDCLFETKPYKYRYFEYFFINSKGLEVDLSYPLSTNYSIHVLNLTNHLINKYKIVKDRINYTPTFLIDKCKVQNWNNRWNSYIRKLQLIQATWRVIKSDNTLEQDLLSNVHTLVLPGYPQNSDLEALKFVVKLLIEGNVSCLHLKFPSPLLFKAILLLLKSAGEKELKFMHSETTRSFASFSMRSQIKRFWQNSNQFGRVARVFNEYDQNYRSNSYNQNYYRNYPNNRNSQYFRHSSFDFPNRNVDVRSNLSRSYSNDDIEPNEHYSQTISSRPTINANHNMSDLINLQNISSLSAIDECSNEDKILFYSPKFNNLCFLKSLNLFSIQKGEDLELLGQVLLKMNHLESLNISSVIPYLSDLDSSLVQIVIQNKVKHLSLSNIRLISGAMGFLYRILTENSQQNCLSIDRNTKLDPINLISLKLDMIKYERPRSRIEFNRLETKVRKTNLKQFVWIDLFFSYARASVLQKLLQNSPRLEKLELKSIQDTNTFTMRCIQQVTHTCSNLNELSLKKIFLNNINETLCLINLIKKNQLSLLHIENGFLFVNEESINHLYNALSKATNLKTLGLPMNNINNNVVDAICNFLENTENIHEFSLECIDLSMNSLLFNSLKRLCITIKTLKSEKKLRLKYLKIKGNNIGSNEVLEIKEILKTSNMVLDI